MSTVSKSIADACIAGNGYYPGDHIRVVKVVKYQNGFDGADAYGIIYEGKNLDAYAPSQFVRNPVTYWEYKAS
jgi:hypothetical protein